MNQRLLPRHLTVLLLALFAGACAAPPPDQNPSATVVVPAAPSAVPTAASSAVESDAQADAQADAQFDVWAVSGMERIGRDEPARSSAPIELYAARGEYEPFQVAVRAPREGLTGVSLAVSELRGPDGAVIDGENLTLYREHYVEVRDASPDSGGTNRPLGLGWYADALIPFETPDYQKPTSGATLQAVPVSVAGEQNQPFWVDIFVPRDAAPGPYRGTFTVSSDQGQAQGEVILNVWDFELPLKPTLLSAFDLEEQDTIGNIKELLRHRLMPNKVPAEDQRELIDEWGLGATDVNGFWSGANIDTCKMKSAPKASELREAIEEYQTDLVIYNYTADEIDRCPKLAEPLAKWARRLHEAGIDNMVTMMPTERLLKAASSGRSAVDIWVVLPKRYVAAPELAAMALDRGTQIWSYNAGVQDDYSPKWQIDFAPINFRIQPGFISQSLGFSGLLYWRIEGWTDDPWNDVSTYSNGKYMYSGDGMMVYPGEQVGIDGVVPSMRLKWIREGIEDYEYVALLKERGQGAWALEMSREVGADWSNWTQDVPQLERVRQQLGEALSTGAVEYTDTTSGAAP